MTMRMDETCSGSAAREGLLRPGLSVVVRVDRLDTGEEASATTSTAPAASIDRRRMAAFVCMVFGKFMAILDIQIVSASLAEIQAGLSASTDEIS
jgi:hypothetical protein